MSRPVLLILIAFTISGCSRPKKSEPREWYEGGTLHDKTLSEWAGAADEDRLATASDFARIIGEKIHGKGKYTMQDVRPYAVDILVGLDGMMKEPENRTKTVRELAPKVMTLLGY